MFNPNARTSDAARSLAEAETRRHAIHLPVVIVTDDQATAQALVAACDLMAAFDCRVRVAALRDDPADLRLQPDEVVIVDDASARDRRVDAALHPASPCVSIARPAARVGGIGGAARAHARLHFSDLSPASLELAIAAAQENCRALTTARRSIDALERSARAACEDRRRVIEEIGPIAHALEGLLDIMGDAGAGTAGPNPIQFGLLRNWTHDLVHAVRRRQDAAPSAVARADIGALVDDAVTLFRDKCDARGHTVVLSGPPEPILAPIDPERLQAALRQLMESVFDREACDRRIDIVLWRSLAECRLAFVSGPPARRGLETPEDGSAPPPVRPAGPGDTHVIGALAQLRELGAIVETSSGGAFGSNLLVSLPVV